ncbi:MAG: hypothetical protein ACKVWV_11565 [Planctomycetota bacterium]
MATTITISKASSATHIDLVRHDDALWQVAFEIEGFLATRNIQQVVAADIRALLAAAHGQVDMVDGPGLYGVLSTPFGLVPYCHRTHTISVREQATDEPVVIEFEVSATYS